MAKRNPAGKALFQIELAFFLLFPSGREEEGIAAIEKAREILRQLEADLDEEKV